MNINTWSDHDEVICPYCGHVHKVEYEDFEGCNLEFDDEKYECENCGKTMLVRRSYITYYETYKEND